MSLNNTPLANRVHIGIFGKRNAGKSSIINAITGQKLSIVSDVKGTTTDPVLKAMELLPLGPVVMIDTPGIDDKGELGKLRVKRSYQMLNKSDVALLVIDGKEGISIEDEKLLQKIKEKEIPYLIVVNKADKEIQKIDTKDTIIYVSAKTGKNIWELKEKIATLASRDKHEKPLVSDLIAPSDFVLLVVPIDKAAPKGRLILPQQQTIRDILDTGGISIVVKENNIKDTLSKLKIKPKLVITDSQVFDVVAANVPEDIWLTSFSILFARYKGNLSELVKGAKALETLQDNDNILISEGCTHHRQCDDIGTVKLPALIRKHTGKILNFEFTSGIEFPEELSKYKIVIHCGGCMLNHKEIAYRLRCAKDQGVPATNYGIAIAYMKGILKRSLQPFGW